MTDRSAVPTRSQPVPGTLAGRPYRRSHTHSVERGNGYGWGAATRIKSFPELERNSDPRHSAAPTATHIASLASLRHPDDERIVRRSESSRACHQRAWRRSSNQVSATDRRIKNSTTRPTPSSSERGGYSCRLLTLIRSAFALSVRPNGQTEPRARRARIKAPSFPHLAFAHSRGAA